MRFFLVLFISFFILANAHRDNDDPGIITGTKNVRQFTAEESTLALSELKTFLGEFTEIRVFIASAPGHGHQIATINVMKRFRELGFTGHFQIVYADDSVAASEKLSHLIPGFKTQQTKMQFLTPPGLGSISIISDRYAAPYVSEHKMTLGISGASDEYYAPYAFNSKKFNVDVFLQLQPQEWRGYGSSEDIAFKIGSRKSLTFLNSLNIVTQPKTELNRQDIAAMAGHPALGQKVDGLLALIKALPEIDLLPAYAIDINNQPDLILRLTILGLNRARARNPELFAKPVFIPIMTEFNGNKRNPVVELNRLGVPYVSILDLPRQLEALKNSPVVAVQVGALTPEVFDFLFTKATLPALLEGKNLQNLMLARGLPFLNIVGHHRDGLNVNSAPAPAKHIISEAFDVFGAFKSIAQKNTIAEIDQALDEWTKNDGNIEKIGRFITDAKIVSPLRRFFASKRVDPQSPQNDKVAQAILILKETMNEVLGYPQPLAARCAGQFAN